MATDWFVTRNASTSETDCCCARAARVGPASASATQAKAIRLIIVVRLLQIDARRRDRTADHCSRDCRAVAIRQVSAPSVLVVGVPACNDPAAVRRVREAESLRGGGRRGPLSLLDVVVPVALTTIESSITLAEAMEARGYGSGPRTRFRDAHQLYERHGYVRNGATRELHDLSHTVEYHYLKELTSG